MQFMVFGPSIAFKLLVSPFHLLHEFVFLHLVTSSCFILSDDISLFPHFLGLLSSQIQLLTLILIGFFHSAQLPDAFISTCRS